MLVSDGDHPTGRPWDLVPEPFQSICRSHSSERIDIMKALPTAKHYDQIHSLIPLHIRAFRCRH
jgi:hypothetical protein